MFYFNGKPYVLPGVIGLLEIIQAENANIPDFNVGLIIGKSMKGAPYSSSVKGSEVMLAYSSINAVAKDYGYDDIYKAFDEAQKLGAGTMFILNAQPNTPASVTLKDASSSDSMKLIANPKIYGIFGNDPQLSIIGSASDNVLDSGTASAAASTSLSDSTKTWTAHAHIGKWVKIIAGTGIGQSRKITENTTTQLTVAAWTTTPDTTSQYQIVDPKFQATLIPTKNEKIITANVLSTDNTIYVNSVMGLSAGLNMVIASNTGVIGTFGILNVSTTYNSNKNGYQVILDSKVGSAIDVASYPRLFQYDTDQAVVVNYTNADYTFNNIPVLFNAAQDLYKMEVASGATGVPADIGTLTRIQDLTGATKGVNPSIGSNDWAMIANNYPDWLKEFENTNKMNIRLICVLSSDDSVHAVFDKMATIVKGQDYKKPVQIITGLSGINSVSACNTKAAALNSDQIILCVDSFEGKDPYMAEAPQVFGSMQANNPTHNLTRDLLSTANIGKEWSIDEQKSLVSHGCMFVISSPTGYRIARGVNTYQDQTNQWNVQDKKTFLIQQKQLADLWHIGIMKKLDEIIGNDNVTAERIATAINATGNEYKRLGYITDYVCKKMEKIPEGWNILTESLLPGLTDFIGVTNRVIVGNS